MADLGTLLPLMIALVVINHLNPVPVLMVVALAYILSGLYYRIPMPVQPLKALSATAISLGLSAAVIGAAGLLTGLVLLFLSLTNLITPLVRFFPKAVIRGIQLSIGLILLRSGALLAIKPPQTAIDRTFSLGSLAVSIEAVLFIVAVALFFLFRKSQHFPATVAIVILGVGASIALGASPGDGPSWATDRPWLVWPQGDDFLTALVLLVIPQLPLTLGNAVVSTWQTAGDYFQDRSSRVTPRALTTSMGLANIAAGVLGAMPVCHGSGGLTAHYRLGARTGGANIMIGGLFLVLALTLGTSAISVLSLIPFSVLGVLLMVVGIYHALLARDLRGKASWAAAAMVAVVTLLSGNLALGFIAGMGLYYWFRWLRWVSAKKESV